MKFRTTTLAATTLLGVSLQAANAEWTRLSPGDLREHPKNLAREHLGATLYNSNKEQDTASDLTLSLGARDENQSALSLLCDDPSIGWPAVAGDSEVILELAEIEVLGSLGFALGGGAGKVVVHTALTGSAARDGKWHEAGFAVFDAGRRSVRVQMGGIDAKYVRLTFQMAKPGKVYNFGLYGQARASEFALRSLLPSGEGAAELAAVAAATRPEAPQRAADDVAVSLLGAYSGGSVAYVSSGAGDPTALADGDATTTYTFSPDDAAPTVVFDLGTSRNVDRATALVAPGAPSRVDFFALNTLPETEDWVGRTALHPGSFAETLPNGEAEDGGAGIAASSFELVNDARYVVFRFQPTGRLGTSDEGLEIAELAAFQSGFGADAFVSRDGWLAKAVSAKAPRRAGEGGPMEYYAGPLAGYSGSAFLGRGSGGLARAQEPEVVTEVVTEVVEVERVVEVEVETEVPTTTSQPVVTRGTTGHNAQSSHVTRETTGHSTGGASSSSVPVHSTGTQAPVIQVVSRIAVSATTVPGVGHLYFNAGTGPAPAGYTFELPGIKGTHPSGIIEAETVATLTTTAGTPGQVFKVGTSFLHPNEPAPTPVDSAATAVSR